MHIGFIGLSNIGLALVERLLAAGHAVRAWDSDELALARAVSLGAQAAGAAAEAAAQPTLISNLSCETRSRSLFDDDLLAHQPKGGLHINAARLPLGEAVRLPALHARYALSYVAAPMFGSVEAARHGELSIIAGGSSQDLRRAEPLLEILGQSVWHAAPVAEHAHLIAIAHGLAAACAAETMQECASLARGYGMSADVMLEGLSRALAARAAPPDGDHAVSLAVDAGSRLGARLPLAQRLHEIRPAIATGQTEALPSLAYA